MWNGFIGNVVSTLPNVVKIDVEIHNIVSALPNVVKFNVEIHNVVSTLLNVVNFNVDVHNAVSTLIWRCTTSRRHINLKATLNRRWNVCWDVPFRHSDLKGEIETNQNFIPISITSWYFSSRKLREWFLGKTLTKRCYKGKEGQSQNCIHFVGRPSKSF